MREFREIYFTSDLHLGHANCIEFDERPFKDLEHMHEELIRKFNSTVPPNGITYFLGDISLKKMDVKSILDQMNGIKVLVLGNHDFTYSYHYKNGFDVVLDKFHLTICNEPVTLAHAPLKGIFRETDAEGKAYQGANWHGEHSPKMQRFIMKDEGQYHLHGHIHSRKGGIRSQRIAGKQFDVGVVANNYAPVKITQIESWIAKVKNKEVLDGK